MNYKSGIIVLALICFGFVSTHLGAQTKAKPKQKAVEKEKAAPKEKMTIVIDGDHITINGKPITEYDGDNIVIRKKNLETTIEPYVYAQPRVRMSPRVSIATRPPAHYDYDFNWEEPARIRSVQRGAQLGVTTDKDDKGLKITEVVDGSAAAKAGLKSGDIITTVNGEKMDDADDLYETISEKKPGQEVEIGYIRDKKTLKQKVVLGERKTTTASSNRSFFKTPQPYAYGPDMVAPPMPRISGDGSFNFYRTTPKLGIRIEDTEAGDGVRVLYVEEGSIAEKSGIKENDLITSIDSVDVKDTNKARNALMEAGEKQEFQVVVKRGGSPMTLQVKIPKRLNKTDL